MDYFHQMLVSHEIGGAGHIALRLASFLKSRSLESHVWLPGEGPALSYAEKLELPWHNYNAAKLFSPSKFQAIVANLNVGRKLGLYSPGIIHIHSPFYYRVLYFGLKFSNLKCLVHVHLDEEEEGLRWAFKNPPDIIVTCAEFLVKYVQKTLPERYKTRQRIVSVPNAVDIERFSPGDKFAAKLRVDAPIGTPLVLMLANLAPHKGQEVALRATAILKEIGVNIVLWFGGDERGSERRYTTYLRSLANDLLIGDRVQFLGYRDDVPDLLRAADIFVLPSTREGLPLSILEAQATKVPVVAAPTAGIPEVVSDGETGFLIAPDDIRGYADCIKSLLNNMEIYHDISEKAYAKIVNDHTFEAYFWKVSQLYECLLNSSR